MARIGLRVAYHTEDINLGGVLDQNALGTFTGGGLADELAALLSLETGGRIATGGVIRTYYGNDAAGRPAAEDDDAKPFLTLRPNGGLLPTTPDEFVINTTLIGQLPLLSAETALALVRVASLYQKALWISDEDPGLSWLFLVSAIEAAAAQWYHRGARSPEEELRDLMPSIATLLEEAGGSGLVEGVAKKMTRMLGATKKFTSFLVTFCPAPPDVRPEPWLRVDWSSEALQQAFLAVYQHRSAALHAGIPFPFPMCQEPFFFGQRWPPSEKPMQFVGWEAVSTPFQLHIFEYVARRALLSWWQGLLPLPNP